MSFVHTKDGKQHLIYSPQGFTLKLSGPARMMMVEVRLNIFLKFQVEVATDKFSQPEQQHSSIRNVSQFPVNPYILFTSTLVESGAKAAERDKGLVACRRQIAKLTNGLLPLRLQANESGGGVDDNDARFNPTHTRK